MDEIKMGKITTITTIALIIIWGCTLKSTSQLYSFSTSDVSVVGNTIYRGGKPFVELRYFSMGMTDVLTESTWVDGLAIYFYQNDKEVWIYPKEGLSIHQNGIKYDKTNDMKRVWGNYLRDRAAYNKGELNNLSWPSLHVGQRKAEKVDAIRKAYGIKISDDGKYVYYKTQGMIWDSSHKYLIEW